MIRIGRYNRSRFWGVWCGEVLIAVTVYRKGAVSVAELATKAMGGKP